MARTKDRSLGVPIAQIIGEAVGDGTPAGEDLARRIEELITTGALAAGARLPSERDLAEMLSISRPIVSQAIRILVVRGLVDSRRGSGSYVVDHQPSLARLVLEVESADLPKMAEFRLWLETTGVAEAVLQATPEEIKQGECALHRLRDCVGDTASWMSADTVFHATLVDSAHNPYLSAAYRTVHTSLIRHEYQQWMTFGEVPSWLHRSEAAALHGLHAPILHALKDRDTEAAKQAVLRHHEAMTAHLAAADEAWKGVDSTDS